MNGEIEVELLDIPNGVADDPNPELVPNGALETAVDDPKGVSCFAFDEAKGDVAIPVKDEFPKVELGWLNGEAACVEDGRLCLIGTEPVSAVFIGFGTPYF